MLTPSSPRTGWKFSKILQAGTVLPRQALSTVVPLLSAAAGPSSQRAVRPLSRLGRVTRGRRRCFPDTASLDLSGFPSLCSLRRVPAVVTLTFLTGPSLLVASDSTSTC